MAVRILLLLALVASVAVAQQNQSPGMPAAVQPGVAASTLVLPKGQIIWLALRTKLSSKRSKVGDAVEFEVQRPIKLNDLTVIAEGAIATGKVSLVEPPHRKGVAGRLGINLASVSLVNGDSVPLRVYDEHSGQDKREEINANMGEMTMRTFGFGAPLVPLFLLQKGADAKVEPGTKLQAVISTDIPLDDGKLRSHQPVPRQDVAVVYLFNADGPRAYVTCGSQALGDFSSTEFHRLELPPGRYWFHGMASPHDWQEKILRRPVDEFVMLDVKAGATYYLQLRYALPTKFFKATADRVEQISATEGEKLLQADIDPSFHRIREMTPETLQKLQAQPLAEKHK